MDASSLVEVYKNMGEKQMGDQYTMPLAVLGAGSWGCALAIHLARHGQPIRLWDIDRDHLAAMAKNRVNEKFLPDIELPESIQINDDLASTLADVHEVLIVAPSHAFRDLIKQIAAFLSPGARLIWGTKGLDMNQGTLLDQVVKEELGESVQTAVISGPSFASEVAKGLPTAVTLASHHHAFAIEMGKRFSKGNFRVYLTDDMAGVQVCGAVKNVLAVAAGISDGLDLGANARCAMITRGLAEMARLGMALGARQETFMGLAGVGDVILTCTDNQSRNRRLGIAIGQGFSLKKAEEKIGQVVESVYNISGVYQLSLKLKVDMPITHQVYQVLHNGLAPKLAVQQLLARPIKEELDIHSL